jgi:hypothetical protein
MIHLPWILFLIGNIGYTLYDNDPGFWFRNTNDRINDDLVMLISVFVGFIGFVSSVIVYGDKLIN